MVKLIYACALLFLSITAHAAPTLSPDSGSITPDQTFTFNQNDIAVARWWIYIGTAPGLFDIANTRDSELNDLQQSYTGLPLGAIYLTLWFVTNGQWNLQAHTFTVQAQTSTSPSGGTDIKFGTAFNDCGDASSDLAETYCLWACGVNQEQFSGYTPVVIGGTCETNDRFGNLDTAVFNRVRPQFVHVGGAQGACRMNAKNADDPTIPVAASILLHCLYHKPIE